MIIKNAEQLLGYLEGGELSSEFFEEVDVLLAAMRKARIRLGDNAKIKGEVTLKLKFNSEGSNTEVEADVTSKHPKIKRPRTFLFLTDGGLSTDSPKQLRMFPDDEKIVRGSFDQQ